jgi:hypothetical protein
MGWNLFVGGGEEGRLFSKKIRGRLNRDLGSFENKKENCSDFNQISTLT